MRWRQVLWLFGTAGWSGRLFVKVVARFEVFLIVGVFRVLRLLGFFGLLRILRWLRVFRVVQDCWSDLLPPAVGLRTQRKRLSPAANTTTSSCTVACGITRKSTDNLWMIAGHMDIKHDRSKAHTPTLSTVSFPFLPKPTQTQRQLYRSNSNSPLKLHPKLETWRTPRARMPPEPAGTQR